MNVRRLTLWTTALSVALIAAPGLLEWSPRFIWNTSASAPIGLYAAWPMDRIEIGDLVSIMPPDDLAIFLAERGYLPQGVPLIKRVLALSSTEVCRDGATIIAYGHAIGEARDRDRLGRDLPRWHGCRVLSQREVFLMNREAPDSLDSRYFGPQLVDSITAQLAPLWTDEDGDGHFEWRAGAPRSPDCSFNSTERTRPMPQIGDFFRNKTGFAGRIQTLTLDLDVTITPAEAAESENAPDYRIHHGEGDGVREIGAAWSRTGEKAGDYLSVLIDDPMLVYPIRANLFQNGGSSWSLHWNRPPKRTRAE